MFGLPDGSMLILGGTPERPASSKVNDEDTLSLPIEVTAWVGEAVAAGITFDVLKAMSSRLLRSGWRVSEAPATATSVTASVEAYLRSSGYLAVEVQEVRQISGQGWSVAGKVDKAKFQARSDEQGRVIHVRVR